jgi:hypothetical protein
VRDKVKQMLPTKFGLAFDGVKAGDEHFVALFAILPERNLLLSVKDNNKILSRKESQLTIEEATSVDCFLKPPVILIEEAQEPQRKRKRLDQEVKEGLQNEEEVKYIDLKWINPTSNVVERFFSLLKRVYTPHRRGMNGDNLERILFLNVNRSFWKLDEIVQVYDKLPIN